MIDDAQRRQLRFLVVAVGYGLLAMLLLYLFWRLRDVLAPFFVAFVLTVVMAPVVDKLQTRGMARGWATLFVYVFVLVMVVSLLFILVPLVSSQIGQIVTDLRTRLRLDEPGSDLGMQIADQIQLFGRRYSLPMVILQPLTLQAKNSAVLFTRGLETFGNMLLGFLPNLIHVILVPILAYYALIDYHTIFAKLMILIPRGNRDGVRSIAVEVTHVFGNYLRGLGIVCLVDGVTTFALLMFFPATRPYAAALGLMAALLYAIPFVGSVITLTLTAFVAFLSQEGSAGVAVTVVMCNIFTRHFLIDQILSPRIIGKQVGLHPILTIFALLSGNALFGVGGLLLAVPVAASLQVILVHIQPRLARKVEVAVERAAASAEESSSESVVVAAGAGDTVTVTVESSSTRT